MLHTEIYKNSQKHDGIFSSSKKIDLAGGSAAILQVSSSDEKLGSFIESTVIDLILTNFQSESKDVYTDFGYLLEKLNKYFKEIAKNENLSGVNIFLGITESSTLHFSVLGRANVYLIKKEKVLNIAEWMGAGSDIPQFSYISSGTLSDSDTIHISNVDILDSLTTEDILEITHLVHSHEKTEVIENLLDREIIGKYAQLIAISSIEERKTYTRTVQSEYLLLLKKWLTQAASFVEEQSKKLLAHPSMQETVEKATTLLNSKNRFIRSGLFWLGIIVCVTLLYVILSSLFDQKVTTAVPEEYKNKLIEAQLIIEKSNKDLGNRDVFNQNIKKAEDIIFEVRKKQIFLNDVKKLLADISILKKQMNGVESFDTRNASAEYLFTDISFGLGSVFEIAKKLYFVGKNGVIGPYIKWGDAKKFDYPDAEEAISADATPEGYIYIFTKTGRILRFYKGEYSYINVEGQKTWEKGRSIRLFNSNLYILGEDGKQIFKHKPGINGFSSRTEVLQTSDLKNHTITDFGVDGGFYLVKDDLSIDKIFGLPNYSRRSIVINNLPENYKMEDGGTPKLFIAPNLNYLYMILNNRIWIFEPDTKNYKDVKSIRYIGQIEFIDEKIQSIWVPKDGNIIAGTDRWIYTVNFEVSDGKVIVR